MLFFLYYGDTLRWKFASGSANQKPFKINASPIYLPGIQTCTIYPRKPRGHDNSDGSDVRTIFGAADYCFQEQESNLKIKFLKMPKNARK